MPTLGKARLTPAKQAAGLEACHVDGELLAWLAAMDLAWVRARTADDG